MPRTKSKPTRRDTAASDSTTFNELEFFFDEEVEEEDDSPKKRRKVEPKHDCKDMEFMMSSCSSIQVDNMQFFLNMQEKSQETHPFSIGSLSFPLSANFLQFSETVKVGIHRNVVAILDGSTVFAHVHVPPSISKVISSCRKAGSLLYQIHVESESNACRLEFFLLPTAVVTPAMIDWLEPSRLERFHWFGEKEVMSLNSQAFLASFTTTWEIKPVEAMASLRQELQAAGIDANLRQYQLEGIHWLWERLVRLSYVPQLFPGWIQVSESPVMYYNEVWQYFLSHVPTVQLSLPSCVLADEMGIGKSLQVISFILLLRSRIERAVLLEPVGLDLGVETRIQQFFEERNVSTQSRQRRRSAIVAEAGAAIPCVCERSELEKGDIGWIDCSLCHRPRHLRCAGLTSPSDDSEAAYQCLSCVCTYHFHHPIPSKTTLIIMPGTLLNQWQNEIKKHVNRQTPLRVCIYRGKRRPQGMSKQSPQFLATFDIILISYKALKACFHEADLNWASPTASQSHRRYDVYPPPLLGLEFSTIVIDETQNIEGASENMILKMAMKLRTRRKLSVSGTPFGIGTTRDLLHLAQFLEIPPLHTDDTVVATWAKYLEQPTLPIALSERLQWLRSLFESRILRRTKDMIRDQLGISERFTVIRKLHMSEFEKKLYIDSVQAINDDLMSRRINDKFYELGKAKIELIRKACCHPRIFDPSLHLGRAGASASIDQVMIMKVEQTKVRCEEAQRDLLFYLFKLAGLRILQALHHRHEHLTPMQAFFASAAAIYHLALLTMQKHRLSTSSYALFQLVGDDAFDSSHLIVPCLSSLPLTWTHSHWQLSATKSIDSATKSEENLPMTWHVGLAKAMQHSAGILNSTMSQTGGGAPTAVSSSLSTITPSQLCEQWFPAIRLGMVHKKTLLGWNLAPVPLWKMEKFCREALSLHRADTLVVAFPAEMSLAASDFHDAFVTVLTRRVTSPADYFAPSVTTPLTTPSTQLTYQAKKTYRAKQWQLNVSQCHTMVLLARFATATTAAAGSSEAVPGIPSTSSAIEFAWAHVDSLVKLAPSPSSSSSSSSTALHLRLWSHVALEETLFDTDQLQELHVQHNFLYALQEVNSNATVPAAVEEAVLHSIKSTQQLPTLCDEMSLLAPPTVTSPSDKMDDDHTNDQQHRGMELTQSIQMAEQRKGLIETDYLGSAVDRRNVAWYKVQEATNKVTQLEAAILEHSDRRDWWTGFVPEYLAHYDLFWQEFDDTVDRSEEAYVKFRGVSHAMQWVHQLRQEFQELTRARQAAVRAMQPLQASPSMLEIAEGAQCQQCRAYFQRYGPVCTHCQRFNKVLQPYKQQHLTAARRRTTHVVSTAASSSARSVASSSSKKTKNILGGVEQYYNDMPSLMDQGSGGGVGSTSHHGGGGGGGGGALLTRQFEEGVVEGAYFMCLRLIRKHAHRALQLDAESSSGHAAAEATANREVLLELVKLEVQWMEAVQMEAQALIALWDRYSELMKTYDEMEQCVSRVQLVSDVDGGDAGEIERFHPTELPFVFQTTSHEAMQAEAYLKETVSTLQFFRRQIDQYGQEMIALEAFEYQQQYPPTVETAAVLSSSDDTTTAAASVALQEDICGICQETMLLYESRVFLPCAHRFHADCVHDWLHHHRRCPYCRTAVSPQDICLLHATSSIASATSTSTAAAPSNTVETAASSSVVGSGAIAHMKRPLTSSLTCHNAAGDEVETVDHPTASIPAFTQMLKRVKGRWGTKIDALIADILLIVTDPLRIDEKAIVFSQWSEMLEIVADALRMNQIPFTSCFNRQRDFEDQRYGVEAFRHDPHLRLLLLPLHLGAEGLDLVVASHVFLLEPLLDPSQEAQAINRIDRLGQRQRATYVHKYLLSDTIEERITLLQQRAHQLQQQQAVDDDDSDDNDDDFVHGECSESFGSSGVEGVLSDPAASTTMANDGGGTPRKAPPTWKKLLAASPLASPHKVHSAPTSLSQSKHKRKQKIGDDEDLGLDDVQFILSLPSATTVPSASSATSVAPTDILPPCV